MYLINFKYSTLLIKEHNITLQIQHKTLYPIALSNGCTSKRDQHNSLS